MTRLYSTEFRCQLCLKEGAFGWIYRCTQDVELAIEDDMERGVVVRLKNDFNIKPRY